MSRNLEHDEQLFQIVGPAFASEAGKRSSRTRLIPKGFPVLSAGVLLVIPVLAVAFLLKDARAFVDNMLRNESIPLWLVLFGTAGQLLFTLRFVYQWLYSRRRGESLLPKGFWLISLAGALVILIYGIIRKDPVLIIAHSFGVLVYVRNLMLGSRNKKEDVYAGS